MAEWLRNGLLAFDTETTGVDVDRDRIVTATTAWLGMDGTEVNTWLINPGVDIPQGATDVHGITTEHAREHGRLPAEALPEIAAMLRAAWSTGVPVVAMNAPYDLTIFDRDLRRYGVPGLAVEEARPVIDPMVIDRAAYTYRKGKRTLTDLCRVYAVDLGRAHDSTEDALAAGRLAWVMARKLRPVQSLSLEELHAAQVAWKAEQADSLREYWTKKGDPRASEVDGSWPLRPYIAEGVA